MYTIHVWNKESPNFDTNEFVRKNGTETFYTDTEDKAIKMMYDMSAEHIEKQTIEDGDGNEMPGNIIFVKLLKLLFNK